MFFIKTFKTFNNYYYYDVNSNSINEISPDLHEKLTDNRLDWYNSKTASELESLINSKRISMNKSESFLHPFSVVLENFLERKQSFMSFQLTQNCNLRCKYCPYTKNDGFNRIHTTLTMTRETINDALNLLINNSVDNDIITLGFYGGEPLLEFDLIKYAVNRVKERVEESKIRFTITTNGTLLNQEILEFLDSHRFSIMISIDGPKHINDKNRVFHKRNESVFDIVIKNIMTINENYNELKSRLGISIVIDPEVDLYDYEEFFNEYDFLNNTTSNISLIDESHLLERTIRTDSFKKVIGYKSFLTYLAELKEIKRGSNGFFNKLIYPNIIKKLDDLEFNNQLPKKYAASGQCIPGNRLFVSVSGNIYPCEKVNELSNYTIMGNVQNGFDLSKSIRILSCSEKKFEDCKNCFAIRHCTNCIKYFSEMLDNNKNFDINNHCNLVREKVLSDLIARANLLEAKRKQISASI